MDEQGPLRSRYDPLSVVLVVQSSINNLIFMLITITFVERNFIVNPDFVLVHCYEMILKLVFSSVFKVTVQTPGKIKSVQIDADQTRKQSFFLNRALFFFLIKK